MANMGDVRAYKAPNQTSLRDNRSALVNARDHAMMFPSNKAVFPLEDGQNTPYASCPPTMEAATPNMLQSASTGSAEPLPTGVYRSLHSEPQLASHCKTQVEDNCTKPFIEIFMCFFCEGEFRQKHLLQQHQKQCDSIPPQFKGAVPYLSQTHKRPEKVKVIPRKPRKLIEDKVTFPCKHVYVESLGLLPQAKAESVRRQSQGRKVDCDVIEVDGSKRAKTPTTPRTPKSLMSQLSRDASPPSRVRLKIGDDVCEDTDKEEEEEESTESSEDEESDTGKSPKGDKYRPRRAITLLSIDVSSLLGERVKKHINAYYANLDNYQTSSPDASCGKHYENFCRTPTKNKVTERLRSRGKDGFQVTFKKTKRTAPEHCHLYKFRRSELVEHCRLVETGLNRRGRALKRQLKKCKVVLDRLNQKDLKKWTKQHKGCSSKLPSGISSPNKQVVFAKFFESIGNPSHVPKTSSSVFPPSVPPGSHQQELKRLLMASTTGQTANVSRQLQLSVLADESISPGTMQQKLLYRNLLSGSVPAPTVTGTAADLTPPSTPEQQSPILVDDDDIICLDDCGSYTQKQQEQKPTSLKPTTNARTNLTKKISTEKTLSKSSIGKQASRDKSQDTVIIDADKDDDVISISSTESVSDITIVSPESLKRQRDWTPESSQTTKRRRIDHIRPAALLFRCHLCFEEITCHDNANIYIKSHFAKSHNVYNIDLIEHLDANGQKVVSIVEVPTPEKQPPPSSFVLTNRANNTPLVVPTQFYGGHNGMERKKNKTAARTKQQAKPKSGLRTTKSKAKNVSTTTRPKASSKNSVRTKVSSKANAQSAKTSTKVKGKASLSTSKPSVKQKSEKSSVKSKQKLKVRFTEKATKPSIVKNSVRGSKSAIKVKGK